MTFTRFVEAGRVALVNYGEYLNKLCVIVDILDQNRVLVDFPSYDKLRRQVVNLKRLSLTSIRLDDVKREAAVEDVKKAYESADVEKLFAATGWGKKLERQKKRAQLDDFGRFKVMVTKMKKSKMVNAEFEKLKASA